MCEPRIRLLDLCPEGFLSEPWARNRGLRAGGAKPTIGLPFPVGGHIHAPDLPRGLPNGSQVPRALGVGEHPNASVICRELMSPYAASERDCLLTSVRESHLGEEFSKFICGAYFCSKGNFLISNDTQLLGNLNAVRSAELGLGLQ